ncbi:MAG: rRNA maturation RNase YbeY [Planctomycetia bacterium]|nr:rRNA maturation RNase YbeY [Planctomycetia bacterium]
MENKLMKNKPLQISIYNEQKFLSIDESKIKSVLLKMLQDAEILQGSLEVAIVDDPTIHKLNVEFLGHDYATDVLSFEMDADSQKKFLEGNVIVSAETALNRASEFDQTPEMELLLYIIHGTLHLLGYDDHSEEDAPLMRQKETEYLDWVIR